MQQRRLHKIADGCVEFDGDFERLKHATQLADFTE